ncbi:uncharacterized protein LOC135395091 [Ornithodoros turicata]|uniref:uncharacterized protein LOC135395091 n=1 Tax=Ornithodoros turicata TaxID=34597 RepID=UPI003138B326
MSGAHIVYDYSFASLNNDLFLQVLRKLSKGDNLAVSSAENGDVVRLVHDDDSYSDVLFDDIPIKIAARTVVPAEPAEPRPVLHALQVVGDNLEELPDDDQIRIATIKESLHCVDSGQNLDIRFLASLTAEMTAAIWDELETNAVTEIKLAALVKAYLAIDVGLIHGIVFTRHAVMPKLNTMKDCVVSRVLADCLAKFAAIFPQVAIEGLVVPLVRTQDAGKGTNELLRALIKDGLPRDHAALCLRHLLQESQLPRDNLVTLIHTLVTKKGPMENSLPQLLQWILQVGDLLRSDTKFAKLVTDLLNFHGAEMTRSQLESLSGVVLTNGTFLRQPLQNALKTCLAGEKK